jgi:D-alanyl-D-alanine carboxypeptidase
MNRVSAETRRHRLPLFVLVALLAGCAPSPPPVMAPASPGADPDPDVAVLGLSALEARRLPGLALFALRDDEVVLAAGYGHVDAAGSGPVDAHTVFQLGSISKQFLAALVLALVEEQRLSLDDAVVRHLPDFAQLPPALTIRHLLNHTSGVRELIFEPEAHDGFADLSRSSAELEDFVRGLPVDFAPGARWSYSNTNYLLLGFIAERIAGEPFDALLAARFFRPLQLASLHHCKSVPRLPAEAQGHGWRDGAIVATPPENMHWIRGDGGICGSAADLARWTRLLATGKIVSAASYQQMVAPTGVADGGQADYGLGLSLVGPEGLRRVGHNGAMAGYTATAAYYPDQALTVVVLANLGDARTESIEQPIARRLLGLPEPQFQFVPLPDAARWHYTGRYDIGIFDVEIVERDGGLWLEMPPPGPTTSLGYLGGGEFAGEDPEAIRVSFGVVDGPADTLRLQMAGMHWYGQRRP